MFTPTTDDIPYTVLDDSSIESHITKSYMSDGNLIIDIYNPNCEIITVKPATIEYHVTAGMNSVKIFNYTDQYFEVIVGNASDVYTFGSLTKTWDAKNKTVIIGTSDGEPLLTIERVSINPDLCTFEEVLNITSYVDYELNNLKDFRSRWRQYKGTNNITSVDWYIQKNQSYNVVVPEYGLIEQSQIIPNIIEYEDVTTTWSCGNCALGNCDSSQYWNISRNTANGTESRTICFDSYEVLQASPLKIKIYWNKTGVISSHNETNYHNVWNPFSPIGKTIHAGQSYVIKMVYHKKPELGDVRIQTIPLFRGVECDELTWWNTSWDKKREIQMDNTGGSALTYYQVNIDLSGTPINSTSLRVVNEAVDATVPHWQETISSGNCTDLWFNATSISASAWLNGTYYIYYENADVSSESSGDDTFIQWHGTASSSFVDSLIIPYSNSFIYESTIKSPTSLQNLFWGISNVATIIGADTFYIQSYSADNVRTYGARNEGVKTTESVAPSFTVDQLYKCKLIFDGTTVKGYIDSIQIGTGVSSNLPNENMGLFMYNNEGTAEQDWSFVRKYTATEPTCSIGAEEEAPAAGNIIITSYAPTTPITLEASTSQLFNVTVDNNSQCRWYLNTSLIQTNSTPDTNHSYTNGSLNVGHWNFTAYVNDSTDNDSHTWWVTVVKPVAIPPNPTDLTNTTGNFWIRHAWNVGVGNITDGYNVSVNGSWYNTTDTFINLSKSPHGYQDIMVQAWNESGVGLGGPSFSTGNLTDNVTLANNPVTLTNYSILYSIQEFDTITIDFDYIDADGDVVTFATDASSGTMNDATGVWTWTTTWMNRSVNHWTFNVSDGYGSVDSIEIEIEVTAYPVTPIEDTFQYYPGGDVSANWHVETKAGCGTPCAAEIITSDNKRYFYIRVHDSYGIAGEYAQLTMYNPYPSNYWSMSVPNVGQHANMGIMDIFFYDEYGYEILSKTWTTTFPTAGFWEFVRDSSTGDVAFRIDGVNQGSLGTASSVINYIRFKVRLGSSSTGTNRAWLYIDDFSVNGNVVGIGTESTSHTVTELNTAATNISYTIKSFPAAIYQAAEYKIEIKRSIEGSYATIENEIVKAAGNTSPYHGYSNWNRSADLTDNDTAYGLYMVYLTKDGVSQASDYFFFAPPGDASSISFSDTELTMGVSETITYTIDGADFSMYNYKVRVYGANGQVYLTSVLDASGSVSWDTTDNTVGVYFVVLTRTHKTTGTYAELAYDYATLLERIDISGYAYDAQNGTALSNVNVNFNQESIWYNTTTNAIGHYELTDILIDVEVGVAASLSGYIHDDFTFTPLVAGNISLDLYLLPNDSTIIYNGTAIGGLVLCAPYYQALNGATVNLWNSSWSDDTASSATGYYLFDDIVNGSFTGNATMEGYSTASGEEITTALSTYTYQNYLLQPQNTLTVKAKDVSTHATIMSFSMVFEEGATYETTEGFVNITTGIGIYKVEVTADGYYVGIDYATVIDDTELTLYLVPIEESGEGIYYPSHYVSFLVQSITGERYEGINTTVYIAADSNAIYSDVTGSDGVVGFELNETTLYRLTFVNATQGINEEFTLYPIDTEYIVIVSSSISFDPGTPDINLTNTTIQYTNQSWSVQNLTGDYLSTTLGISHTGQGVIAATICWATATIACGVPTLIVLGILAQLGVVSWIMVLFTGMTMLSIYILGGKIG